MSALGVADSAQLTIRARALDAYCAKHRLISQPEREEVAFKIMCLFQCGLDHDQIASELEKVGQRPFAGPTGRTDIGTSIADDETACTAFVGCVLAEADIEPVAGGASSQACCTYP